MHVANKKYSLYLEADACHLALLRITKSKVISLDNVYK